MGNDKGWKDTAKDIGLIIAKIVLYPWGIYSLCRFAISRIAMTAIYPAQSILLGQSEQSSDKLRVEAEKKLRQDGLIVRQVILEKNGIRYSGLLIGHPDTINNKQWVLHATGNSGLIESAARCAETFYRSDFNTLLVNGPGVGRSEGFANPETIGDAQEIGISFLENAVKAQEIVLSGYSLGGAAIGQAVLKHEFKPNIQYTVVLDKTFDSLNHITKSIFRKFHLYINLNLITWLGLEMDTAAAVNKLNEKKITQIIIQKSTSNSPASTKILVESFKDDGVIPAEASLGSAMNQQRSPSMYRYFLPLSTPHEDMTSPLFAIDLIHKQNMVLQKFIENVNEELLVNQRYYPSRGNLSISEASEEIRIWLREHQDLLKQITSLNLGECDFVTFPSEIEYFVNLDTLILSKEQAALVPPAIIDRIRRRKGFVDKVRFIEGVNRQLDKEHQYLFPADEENLDQVEAHIDAWLLEKKGVLEKVAYLDLSGCNLTIFPPKLSLFSGLKILNLSGNAITSIPFEMLKKITQLETLDLSNNKIETIPYSIASLSNLKALNLSHNTICSLHPAISNLKRLETLDLSHNKISEFPPPIFFISSLETLDLSHNTIVNIPDAIGGLRKLKALLLNHNEISDIPDAIGGLQSLGALSLSENKISFIPPGLSGLWNLEILDLSHNRISSLSPAEIPYIEQLKTLKLTHNKIFVIPAEISTLRKLKTLEIIVI